MLCHRLIARLDVKGANVVKGIHMEGLRVMGKPAEFATRYAEDGADELLFIDTVASLYGRNQLSGLLSETCEHVFVPITVGGGITSVEEARRLFNSGADKIAINTGAIKRPVLIRELAGIYGSQAVAVSIQAKRTPQGYEAYTDCGREKSGRDAIAWAHEAVALGAGEILITSIDRDGTRKGFDIELCKALAPLPVPVVACGGMGTVYHLKEVFDTGLTAAAFASVLHYGKFSMEEIKDVLRKDGYPIRAVEGKFHAEGTSAARSGAA